MDSIKLWLETFDWQGNMLIYRKKSLRMRRALTERMSLELNGAFETPR